MNSLRQKKLVIIEVALAFIVSLVFLAYFQFQRSNLPETDGYYHIKAAYLEVGATEEAIQSQPEQSPHSPSQG